MNEKKEKKKFPRISLLAGIGIVFLLAWATIVVAASVLGRHYLYKNSLNHSISEAKAAVIIGESALLFIDPDLNYEKDADVRKAIHDEFRLICQEMDCQYLYLFKLDKDGTRTHIISAANTDEDEEKIKNSGKFGFGEKSYSPVSESEAKALKGDTTGDYKLINNEYGNVLSFVIPIPDGGNGNTLLAADYSISKILQDESNNMRKIFIIVTVLFVAFIIVSLILIHTYILSPVNKISLRMANFLRDRDTAHLKINPRRNDEIADINNSFEKMAGELKNYLADVERLTTEKVAGEVELSVARRIQNGMVSPRLSASGSGYETAAFMHPAREIGGDFYDLLNLDDGRVALIIGDVSGKGVTAAIFMVLVRCVIRDRILLGISPAETLRESNELICSENPEGMFATVFAAICDPRTGKMVYANAGHNRPFIIGGDNREVEVKSGIALGLFEDADIFDEELTLEEGTGILLYTDGVSEAVNDNMEQFGMEGIRKVLAGNPASAEESVDALIGSIKEFTGTAPQFDDITAVVYFHKKPDKILCLKPELQDFARVKERIFYELPNTPYRKNVILACEEWFANVIMYSKADCVNVTPVKKDDYFTVEFADNGEAFDPVSYSSPDKDFEDLDTGGMGINLVKDIAAEMKYQRIDGQNKLLLVFKEP